MHGKSPSMVGQWREPSRNVAKTPCLAANSSRPDTHRHFAQWARQMQSFKPSSSTIPRGPSSARFHDLIRPDLDHARSAAFALEIVLIHLRGVM